MAVRIKLKPCTEATGDHTNFLVDILGRITNYATYIFNRLNPSRFDEKKRVDLYGKGDFNKVTQKIVETPHVHESDAVGGVRPAKDDEIPKRNKQIDNGNT